jgi:hypothetical protein
MAMMDGRARRLFGVAAAAGVVCASLGAGACAPGAPYNPDRLPAAQMSRIVEICRSVMGLGGGHDTHSLACQESLSHSLAARTGTGGGAPAEQALRAQLPAAPATSYFSASNDEIHRREQQACAAIGEDPGRDGFARCVADLASYLFDADNPIWRD